MSHFDGVESISVQHDEPPPRSGFVNKFILHFDFDAAFFEQGGDARISQELIMIAGGVANLGPAGCEVEQAIDDLGIDGIPMPARAEFPTVEEISEDVELFGANVIYVVEEMFSLGKAASQMYVADDDGSNATFPRFQVDVH